jgi:lysophospholipase L1-like esterase
MLVRPGRIGRFGYRGAVDRAVAPTPAPAPTSYASFVAIGDSITQGFGATTTSLSWVSRSATNYGATALNQGIGGTILVNAPLKTGAPQTNNGRDRFVAAMTGSNKKAAAFIAYGFNDARYTKSLSSINVGAYAAQLREVVTGLFVGGYAMRDIFIIAPYYITDAGLASPSGDDFAGQTRSSFETFVAAARSVAEEFGTEYFDAYAYMLNNGAASLIGTDNIHPNDAGYQAIATGLFTTAAQINTRPTPGVPVVTSPASGQLSVSFAAPSGATAVGYEVGYGVEADYDAPVVLQTTGTAVDFTGLATDSYRVRVRAAYADGSFSPWVFAASAVAVAAPAWTPAKLGSAVISWVNIRDTGTVTTDGAAIVSVANKVQSANPAAQATPAFRPELQATGLNGTPAARMLGSAATSLDQDLAYSGTQATVVWGGSMESATIAFGRLYAWHSNGVNDTDSDGSFVVERSNTAQSLFTFRNGASLTTALPSYAVPVVVTHTFDGAFGQIYTNTLRRGAILSSGPFATQKLNYGIGRETSARARPLTGYFSEAIVCNRPLTKRERWRAEAYMAWGMGTPTNLDVSNPYRSTAP